MAWESHNTKLACFSWDFSVSAHISRDTTVLFFFYFYLMVCLGAIIAQVRDGGDVDKKGVGMKIITAVVFGYFMCQCTVSGRLSTFWCKCTISISFSLPFLHLPSADLLTSQRLTSSDLLIFWSTFCVHLCICAVRVDSENKCKDFYKMCVLS